MIPPLFSHKRYVRAALDRSRRHGGLRTVHRNHHVWQKLKETNLDLAIPFWLFSPQRRCPELGSLLPRYV